ncbi:MAG: porin family protein [Bacteroidota bacterium]
MKKLFLISSAIVAAHFTSNAQTPRFGFTAGAVMSNLHTKDANESESLDLKPGLTFGILVNIPVGKHFSFEPALNFLQKGAKNEDSYGGITEKTTANLNCIELPLNFIYNTAGAGGNFFIGAGPSIAIALQGKSKHSIGDDSDTETIEIGNNDDDDVRAMDIGMNVISGYRFHGGLMLALNYNLGLRNLIPGGSDDITMKSSYFGIKLGFLLK